MTYLHFHFIPFQSFIPFSLDYSSSFHARPANQLNCFWTALCFQSVLLRGRSSQEQTYMSVSTRGPKCMVFRHAASADLHLYEGPGHSHRFLLCCRDRGLRFQCRCLFLRGLFGELACAYWNLDWPLGGISYKERGKAVN